MSAFTGPNIVEDGLVLMLDVANGESFRGEPTTNNAGTGNIYTNWNNSGTATWVNNDTSVNRPYSEVQVNSMYKDTTGNSHIAVGNGTIDGTTWTFSVSVYILSSAGTLAGSVPYFRSFPANVSRGALAYNGSTNWNSWPRDTWIRIERTWTNTAGDTSAYISCYLDTAGNKIYLSAPQLENKSYATPFVNGTRGTTVATGGGWADLSGNTNNGELVNGPTYNSSNLGSLVFDGADTGIVVNNFPQIFNQSVGMSGYFFFNDDSRGILFGNFDTTNSINFEKHTSRRLRLYWAASTLVDVFTSNSVVDLNKWHHIHIQRNKEEGRFQFFVDGILIHNPTVTSIDIPSTSTIFRIGRDSRDGTTVLNGNISQVQIYNRALTAAEVLQNYNATKGRFGL